jgi:pimeloyl-ACP methyl ester carboxylesterase
MAFAENQGIRLYWDELGSGEPLLLISGLGTTSHVWHRSRPVFAQRYRTIAFDNRGVGLSDVPGGIYSVSAMASDAMAVLEAAGVEEAHVFGASMGGMIAQELTLQHPERVRSLILGCTTLGGPHAVQPTPDALSLLMRQGMTPEESNAAFEPFLYQAATPRERIDEDMAIRLKWFPSVPGYSGQLLGIASWDAYDRLHRITVPTLVIHGEADRLILPANAAIIAQRIPGAKLVWIPHANHIFWTDQPDFTHRAVLEFLAAHAGRARG